MSGILVIINNLKFCLFYHSLQGIREYSSKLFLFRWESSKMSDSVLYQTIIDESIEGYFYLFSSLNPFIRSDTKGTKTCIECDSRISRFHVLSSDRSQRALSESGWVETEFIEALKLKFGFCWVKYLITPTNTRFLRLNEFRENIFVSTE